MTLIDTMVKTLVNICEDVKKKQLENGKILHIGTQFTVLGQCTGLYYATLYKLKHKDNPYFGDPDLLKRAQICWDYYTTLLDEDGRTHLITFDQSWGYHYEEWNTLHLINTIEMLKQELSHEKIEFYKQKADLSVKGLIRQLKAEYDDEAFRQKLKNHQAANHFIWTLVCIYRYSLINKEDALTEYCIELMNVICESQLPFGTWLEGGSLVVQYAHTTLGAIALFYAYSKKTHKAAYKAGVKNMEYLLKCYYEGKQPIGCFDIRNRDDLDPEFTHLALSMLDIETGVQYNSRHILSKYKDPRELIEKQQSLGFYTAAFNERSTNTELMLNEDYKDEIVYIDKVDTPIAGYSENNLNTIKICEKDFIVPICILTTKELGCRWTLERQNLYSVYHRACNLIIGGGHSISNPHFSCFNIIEGKMLYLHNRAKFISDHEFEVEYGNTVCRIKIVKIAEKEISIKYSVINLSETGVAFVNVPVFIKHLNAAEINGEKIIFKELKYFNKKLEGESNVETDSAYISLNRDFTAAYPIFAFDNYKQEQAPDFKNAYMILTCELNSNSPEVIAKINIK